MADTPLTEHTTVRLLPDVVVDHKGYRSGIDYCDVCAREIRLTGTGWVYDDERGCLLCGACADTLGYKDGDALL